MCPLCVHLNKCTSLGVWLGVCMHAARVSVCLSPSLSDISLASTRLRRQGDGKHAGSGNYGGSKHFSWMTSPGTAEEQAKEGGRQMCCEGGGEGRAFPGMKGGGKKTADEIRG